MISLAELKQYLPKVEAIALSAMQKKEERLGSSMRYSFLGGGKRIRPLLILALVAGRSGELSLGSLEVAAAVEMLHTYSLIHDDLPAMDNDQYRRGQLTNHCQYDEATAILAGDALLTDCFTLCAQAHLSAQQKVDLIQALAQAAGSFGMVEGQMLDMLGEHQQLSLEEVQHIHELKTGALFVFCAQAAVLLTNENEAQKEQALQEAKNFGQHLGLAFQIRDDILDVTKTTAQLGKTAGKDVVSEKSTYTSLLGLEQAQQRFEEELMLAQQLAKQLAPQGLAIQQLIQQLVLIS